jgi:ribosomal protein S27AE
MLEVFNYDQTHSDGLVYKCTMAVRQCLECGDELVMAFHPSKTGQRSPGTGDLVMVTAKWRCGTCGLAFTSAQLRAGKRLNSTVIPKKR